MDLRHGDCLEVLKTIKENSIDSLITDPPAGISFMGKSWDSDKGGRDQWIAWMTEVMQECLRTLKPGGHALVWAIPRTSHWTTTAIENAGFEIRDVVTHLFGSGFPKSLDISKAIDKEAGAKRELIGHKDYSAPDIRNNSYDSPEVSERERLGVEITKPSTDAAKQWQGFGTALKPAAEFWILSRKPLSEKTVAKNVLKWGTGGLNIDGSRIGFRSDKDKKSSARPGHAKIEGAMSMFMGDSQIKHGEQHTQGRFPANLVFTEGEATQMLDEQAGHLVGAGNKTGSHKKAKSYFQDKQSRVNMKFDNGGCASRFFYCAKVSPSERNAGLEGMPKKFVSTLQNVPKDFKSQGRSARKDGSLKQNTHPTVKPQKLMQYLIRLITPPGGKVLDPFMGSGSTGLAAKTLGFDFIGIEKELEYVEIAKRRMTPQGRIDTGVHG